MVVFDIYVFAPAGLAFIVCDFDSFLAVLLYGSNWDFSGEGWRGVIDFLQ